MTDTTATLQQRLEELEREKADLCRTRSTRVAEAEEAIRQANAEFDRKALPLGRRINKLRDKLDSLDTPTATALGKGSHDPEWSQEDIDHYYELRRRNGSK